MEELRFQTRVRIVHLWRMLTGLGLFIGTSGLIGLVDRLPWIPLVMLLTLGTSIACFITGSKRRVGQATISKTGVLLDASTLATRDEISEAHFVPSVAGSSNPLVQLKTRGRNVIQLDVASEAHANEALALLGQDVTSHVFKLAGVTGPGTLTSAMAWACVGLSVAAFALAIAFGIGALVAVGSALMLLTPILFVANDIYVGIDGILIKNRFDTRLLRYEDIATVKPTRRGIAVTLKSAETVQIPLVARFYLSALEQQDQASLLVRIRAAQERHSASAALPAGTTASVASRLERDRDHSFADWIARLVNEQGKEGFRQAALRAEDLIAVLEDHVGSKLSARLGAALLLSKHGGEEGLARIRVAAESSASPKLRIALETIAKTATAPSSQDADSEALEEAMREAEEEVALEERHGSGEER